MLKKLKINDNFFLFLLTFFLLFCALFTFVFLYPKNYRQVRIGVEADNLDSYLLLRGERDYKFDINPITGRKIVILNARNKGEKFNNIKIEFPEDWYVRVSDYNLIFMPKTALNDNRGYSSFETIMVRLVTRPTKFEDEIKNIQEITKEREGLIISSEKRVNTENKEVYYYTQKVTNPETYYTPNSAPPGKKNAILQFGSTILTVGMNAEVAEEGVFDIIVDSMEVTDKYFPLPEKVILDTKECTVVPSVVQINSGSIKVNILSVKRAPSATECVFEVVYDPDNPRIPREHFTCIFPESWGLKEYPIYSDYVSFHEIKDHDFLCKFYRYVTKKE